MATDMEMQLLERINEVSDKVGDIAVQVGKLDGVADILSDHEVRVKKLESWQARLIGGYAAAAVLLGVAFQILLKAITIN